MVGPCTKESNDVCLETVCLSGIIRWGSRCGRGHGRGFVHEASTSSRPPAASPTCARQEGRRTSSADAATRNSMAAAAWTLSSRAHGHSAWRRRCGRPIFICSVLYEDCKLYSIVRTVRTSYLVFKLPKRDRLGDSERHSQKSANETTPPCAHDGRQTVKRLTMRGALIFSSLGISCV